MWRTRRGALRAALRLSPSPTHRLTEACHLRSALCGPPPSCGERLPLRDADALVATDMRASLRGVNPPRRVTWTRAGTNLPSPGVPLLVIRRCDVRVVSVDDDAPAPVALPLPDRHPLSGLGNHASIFAAHRCHVRPHRVR